MKSIEAITKALDTLAPPETAENWDNVGLLAGDPGWKTKGSVISIDLTRQSIELAKKKKFKLIITHHPPIFPKDHGLSKVTPASSLVFDAITNGIATYSSHTNFDRCALEVVNDVSKGLGFSPKGRLLDEGSDRLVKLVVFVPTTHVEKVRKAICEAGAGHIGNYDFCTFGALGNGTFRGGQNTSPFLGKPGKLETAQELRLETIIPHGLKDSVLNAMFKAHPYEEVAYDVYRVEQVPGNRGIVRGLGYGVWGEFNSPRPFSEVVKGVTRLFNLNGFWLTDPSPKRAFRVAFVAGKGTSFVRAAAAAKCDLFITGEVGYHAALSGSRQGMTVMELGHRESERFFLTTIGNWVSKIGLHSVHNNIATQRIRAGGIRDSTAWFAVGRSV